MSLEEIIQKIKEFSGMSEEEIKRKIREKQRELYGLVSPEGAAHILARELGIEVVKKEYVKISEIKPGMYNFNLKVRVSKIFTREFEKNGVKKKVANIFVVDETGEIRLCLWNEQIDMFSLKEGDVVEISGAYSRKNVFGETEIRLGMYGDIKLLPDDPSLPKSGKEYISSTINKFEPGKRYKVRAAIVYVFDTNIFYEVCPECGVIIKDSMCQIHGEVEPEHTVIVNAIIDDGYGNVRAVFFREVGEKLLGSPAEKLLKENSLEKKISELLGKELVFYGKVRKNELFKRKEFIIDDFEEIDPEKETEKILEELNYFFPDKSVKEY